jgi:hypothetical protein
VVLTASLAPSVLSSVPGAGLEDNRRDDYNEADENDLGAQQHWRLLGDEHEACHDDRAYGTDQRFAGASGQMSV